MLVENSYFVMWFDVQIFLIANLLAVITYWLITLSFANDYTMLSVNVLV